MQQRAQGPRHEKVFFFSIGMRQLVAWLWTSCLRSRACRDAASAQVLDLRQFMRRQVGAQGTTLY
jgi:hypothetical protein